MARTFYIEQQLYNTAKQIFVKNKNFVDTEINESKVLIVTGTKTQASQSFSVGMTNVTSDMVCIHSQLGTPSAQTGDWTVITGNGTLTINGEVADGGSTFTLYLIPKRT